MSKSKNKIQKKLSEEITFTEKKERLACEREMDNKTVKLRAPSKFFPSPPQKTEFGSEIEFHREGDFDDYFKREIVDVVDFSIQPGQKIFVTFCINQNATYEKILFLIEKRLAPYLKKRPEKRFRTETLRDLEVYRQRAIGKIIQFPVYNDMEKSPEEYRQTVKKKSFVEIGNELGITEDVARKAFGRMYELIYGTPYRKGAEIKVQLGLLKKECRTCMDKLTCKELCHEVLPYVNQERA